MGKVVIIGAILAVALLVYGIVDLIVTADHRIRRLNRVLWAVIIVLVPIVGPAAWLLLGKAPVGEPGGPIAPDDLEPPSPTASWLSDEESDRRIRDLEEQLRALDEEDAQHGLTPEPEPEAEAVDDDRGDAERHPHEAGRDDDGDHTRA